MAIAFGAITSRQTSSSGTGPTVSGSDTIGIVYHFGDTADNLTGVTWGGVAMTKITSVRTPGDRWSSAWYVLAPSSGATIACTGSTVNSWFGFYYTGVKQSGQPDASTTNTSSSSTTISTTVNVVASNCWTVMMQKDTTGGITYTVDVGVMRANAQGGGEAISDSNGTVGTGNQTTTMTGTSSTHGAIGISLSPSVPATWKTWNGIPVAEIKTFNGIS